jgi:hypothetical protein
MPLRGFSTGSTCSTLARERGGHGAATGQSDRGRLPVLLPGDRRVPSLSDQGADAGDRNAVRARIACAVGSPISKRSACPSLAAQTDPDFTFVALIGDAMPLKVAAAAQGPARDVPVPGDLRGRTARAACRPRVGPFGSVRPKTCPSSPAFVSTTTMPSPATTSNGCEPRPTTCSTGWADRGDAGGHQLSVRVLLGVGSARSAALSLSESAPGGAGECDGHAL